MANAAMASAMAKNSAVLHHDSLISMPGFAVPRVPDPVVCSAFRMAPVAAMTNVPTSRSLATQGVAVSPAASVFQSRFPIGLNGILASASACEAKSARKHHVVAPEVAMSAVSRHPMAAKAPGPASGAMTKPAVSKTSSAAPGSA